MSSANASGPNLRFDTSRNASDVAAGPDWIDIDEDLTEHVPRRRRVKKLRRRFEPTPDEHAHLSSRIGRMQRHAEPDLRGFRKDIGKIVDANDPSKIPRASTPSSGRLRGRTEHFGPERYYLTPTTLSAARSRVYKSRVGTPSERNSTPSKGISSPSYAESIMTKSSARSHASSSTITQQKYDSRQRRVHRPAPRNGFVDTQKYDHSAMVTDSLDKINVMDFLVAEDEGDMRRSLSSSSSTLYQASDVDANGKSCMRSSSLPPVLPTAAIDQSTLEVQDSIMSSRALLRNDSLSPEPAARDTQKQASVSDDLGEDLAEPPIDQPDLEGYRASPILLNTLEPTNKQSDRSLSPEENMRQYVAYMQQDHAIPPELTEMHHPVPATDISNPGSADNPNSPPLRSSPSVHWQISSTSERHSPKSSISANNDAKGYHKVAYELTDPRSSVKPIYRRFEYLNHRLLLHVQDELCEIEEQLRILDSVIAQMKPYAGPGSVSQSRRWEHRFGNQYHSQRQQLLGKIFLKMQQYSELMTDPMVVSQVSTTPTKEQILGYQQWLSAHTPIHECETQFLQHEQDLLLLKRHSYSMAPGLEYSSSMCWTIALLSPLMLSAIVPSLTGRLCIVVILCAVGCVYAVACAIVRYRERQLP